MAGAESSPPPFLPPISIYCPPKGAHQNPPSSWESWRRSGWTGETLIVLYHLFLRCSRDKVVEKVEARNHLQVPGRIRRRDGTKLRYTLAISLRTERVNLRSTRNAGIRPGRTTLAISLHRVGKVPRWVLHFALHSLSQVRAPTSVVADCLLRNFERQVATLDWRRNASVSMTDTKHGDIWKRVHFMAESPSSPRPHHLSFLPQSSFHPKECTEILLSTWQTWRRSK